MSVPIDDAGIKWSRQRSLYGHTSTRRGYLSNSIREVQVGVHGQVGIYLYIFDMIDMTSICFRAFLGSTTEGMIFKEVVPFEYSTFSCVLRFLKRQSNDDMLPGLLFR